MGPLCRQGSVPFCVGLEDAKDIIDDLDQAFIIYRVLSSSAI